MLTTVWDGCARVTYLPARRQVRVTLLTVEATTEGPVRDGLTVGFVSTDRHGPPASVAARLLLQGTVPPDVRLLLGARLQTAVDAVLAGPPLVRWVRLDLAEVDELAAAWAPYRARVLSPARTGAADPAAAAVGRWADGLWTWLGATDLRSALQRLLAPPGRPGFRGTEPDPGDRDPGDRDPGDEDTAVGVWRIPGELAAAAAVDPALTWRVRRLGSRTVLTLQANPTGGIPSADLLVSLDDSTGPWIPFTGEPSTGEPPTGEPPAGEPPAGEPPAGEPFAGEPGSPDPLVAELASDVRGAAGVRFRTEPRTHPPTSPADLPGPTGR